MLTTAADQAGRATRFVQRQSKLTGAKFVQTLVFAWWDNPDATYEQLAQTATALGVPTTPQGLDNRFTAEAADLLKQTLENAVQHAIAADPVMIPLLQRFNGVYVQDGTTIPLPAAVATPWPGCGGSTPEGSSAALKAHVQFNLRDGHLTHLDLQAGRAKTKPLRCKRSRCPQVHSVLPISAILRFRCSRSMTGKASFG